MIDHQMEGTGMNKAIDKAMVMERPAGTAEEMRRHLKDLYDAGVGKWSRAEDGQAMDAIVEAMEALETFEKHLTLKHPAASSALELAMSSVRVMFAAERRARAFVLTEGREESRE